MTGETTMNLARTCVALLICGSLTASLAAQEDRPHIGYVYPAGARQGNTLEVVLGGQHLDGPVAAYVSGEGVQCEIVVHLRPLNQGQFKEMQNRMGELQTRKREASAAAQWTDRDEELLQALRRRLAMFSLRRTSVHALVETVHLRVTIASDAKPGQRELRLLTEQGLTNPMAFYVGQLPEVNEEAFRNTMLRKIQNRGGRGRKRQNTNRPDPGTSPLSDAPEVTYDITLPTIINGQITPGDVDRYRFSARKGQHLVVEVKARELIPYLSDAVPGWFQATVALFDSEDWEVAYEDDFRFNSDPVLHFEVPEDGQYALEIRDAIYRGREDFVYRVSVGELPYVSSVFPLGCKVDEETPFELSGWNLSEGQLSHTFPKAGLQSLSMDLNGILSNSLPVSVNSSLSESLEVEPNDSISDVQPIKPPTIMNGRIDKPGDVDVYRFQCRGGATIIAEVFARRLGSPLDSAIKLTNAQGEQIALNDDYNDPLFGLVTHQADSRIVATIPESGVYYLHVVDSQQHGGQSYAYRLHVDVARPDFKLCVSPSSVNIRAGTTVPITLHAMRENGFGGPMDVKLRNAPPGFILSGGHIPAGVDRIRATLTTPSESILQPVALSFVGQANIDGRITTREAVAVDDVMQAFIYRHLVPAECLQVALTNASRGASPMRVLAKGAIKIPLDGVARVPVDIPTRHFFGEIQLELSEPTTGISLAGVEQDGSGIRLMLRSDAKESKSGTAGNLIINVFAAKTEEDTGKGKEQRKKRRILLSTLPAIPFEITE